LKSSLGLIGFDFGGLSVEFLKRKTRIFAGLFWIFADFIWGLIFKVSFVLILMVRVRYSFGSRHTGRIVNIKKQRGKYPDVVRDVVRISDIVLEILDARFIEETCNLKVEESVLNSGKKLVYVLNKCDLVDVKKLEKSLPKRMKPYVFVSVKEKTGLGDLKARIKMEAKKVLKDTDRKRVHVGVIGYPNAGKSSVINFVTRRGVAKVGAKAGWTRGMQKIKMSEGILILDTPGVISEDKYSTEASSFAKDVKVGARTYSDVKNPEEVVDYLLGDSAEIIDRFYDIESRGDVDILIEELGKKKGFLIKGGEVDVDRTARIILRDWQEGKIGKI
jgi:ribosome biogenesis GTPase A